MNEFFRKDIISYFENYHDHPDDLKRKKILKILIDFFDDKINFFTVYREMTKEGYPYLFKHEILTLLDLYKLKEIDNLSSIILLYILSKADKENEKNYNKLIYDFTSEDCFFKGNIFMLMEKTENKSLELVREEIFYRIVKNGIEVLEQ